MSAICKCPTMCRLYVLFFLVSANMLWCLDGFRLTSSPSSSRLVSHDLRMDRDMFAEADGSKSLAEGSLSGQRYIATNRFKVRDGQGAKFEKRWAERKSRLANLEGFRYFSLLKRVDGDGADQPSDLDDKNYISMTVWENRDNFNEWRTGEAFKEAHGGGGTMLESVVGFTKLLTTQLFILDGGPKVAFYDGLIPAINSANTKNDEKIQGGWRQVEADGKNFIEPDSFVVQSKYTVVPGQEVAFEKKFDEEKASLDSADGSIGFYLLRRDADKADDGYNYVANSIWKSKMHYLKWKENNQGAVDKAAVCPKCPSTPPIGTQVPPKVLFYEGKLTIFGQM